MFIVYLYTLPCNKRSIF